MKNTQTLTDRVNTHWHKCLDVNSSWRNFTNEIGILNTLFGEGDEDLDWLVELFQDNEEFEDEDTEDLLLAVQCVAREFQVPADCIFGCDLVTLHEQGYDADVIISAARGVGVTEEALSDFAEEVEERV